MKHRRNAPSRTFVIAVAAVLSMAGSLGPWSLVARAYTQQSTAAQHAVTAVDCIAITVGDLEKAEQFYTTVLGFAPVSRHESFGPDLEHLTGVFGARCLTARLTLGDEAIELTEFLAPQGRPIPIDSRSNDRWFQHIAIVVSDMDRAYTHLRAHNVRHASSGPQTLPAWNPNAGGISAFYFKDPEGHVLEIIHFPPGKGDPKWQRPTDRLFLGIDHTAIVVEDTDRSLAFYRDALGLSVAGASENYGTEQEHLNNVFGARLRITALRAPRGPGVELLEYLAPRSGRPYPADAQANDLISWRTVMATPAISELWPRLRGSQADWVSPGLVELSDPGSAWSSAGHLRDPDGHAVIVGTPNAQQASPAIPAVGAETER